MPPEEKEQERVPMAQLFFDDIFLLLTLGLLIPLVLYIIWGAWDLVHLPVLKP